MKLGIICGSHRVPSQSTKVGKFIEQSALGSGGFSAVYFYDLADNPLPLWEEKIWDKDPEWEKILKPVSKELASCDAFVVISPEWHGMAPSGLKNFFLMWGNGELAHKPAMLVGVSSADGGAYPVAELRMSSYKNNRICYIPDHIIVRNVESVLNPDGDNNENADQYFRKRIKYSLKVLRAYADGLKAVRIPV